MDRMIISAAGYPGSSEWLAFIENQSVEQITGLVNTIGNNVIVSGIVDDEGISTAGFLIYNNELLPFESSPTGATINIIETVFSEGYDVDEDGSFSSVLPVWKTRKAKFSEVTDTNVVNTFNANILTRLFSLQDLNTNRIKFLKEGEIITSFANNGNQSIATGDFISAELDGASTPLNIIVDVGFEAVSNTNYLIINELIPYDPIFNLAKFSFYDKTVNGFKMSIQTDLPLSTANVSITGKLRILGS